MLMNVYEFFKFSTLDSLYHMVIRHEQRILIMYDPAGRERNNFQQLSKLIELKSISTT